MDAARNLFEQFTSGGLTILQNAVAEGWQESLLLDFKTLEHHAAPMTKTDRKHLAVALSGFANSDGGVIVWGIEARSTGRSDPDSAKQLRPINSLKLFCSDLQRDTPQIVSPGVVGVEHFPISDANFENTGYVVTFVPKSQTEPHMARAKDQFCFYYRSGASFLPMEAFMLADRYGRRPQPKLRLSWRAEHGGQGGNKIHVRRVIGLMNDGQGVALYPALALYESESVKLDRFGLDGNGNTGLPERVRTSSRPEGAKRLFAGGVDYAIHPGTTLDVTCIRRDISWEAALVPDIQIRYELYCQGFTDNGELTVPLMQEFQRIRRL